MNTDWSDHIQGVQTLYGSRQLRFDDFFKSQFLPHFDLDEALALRILEIGCGPGALAGALHRWYPTAEITAIDRDSAFIAFARAHEPGVFFLEGDATALPFPDGSFDVTISNTVSEHIEPNAFFSEQRRVLKPGGVCLVLSSRRGPSSTAACLRPGPAEKAFWASVEPQDHSWEQYAVGRYHQNEAGLPAEMARLGFHTLHTGYALIDLTPDDPKYSTALARRMIEAERNAALESLDSLRRSPEIVLEPGALEQMESLTKEKYAARLAQYDRGEAQWDTNVSVIQIVRGLT